MKNSCNFDKNQIWAPLKAKIALISRKFHPIKFRIVCSPMSA